MICDTIHMTRGNFNQLKTLTQATESTTAVRHASNNLVLFMTNLVRFRTNPFIFRTNLVIFRTNAVIFRANSVFFV